jgi:hypothetical protein
LRTKPQKSFLLENVPKGPYPGKREEWDAIDTLLGLERDRAEAGYPPFPKPDVIARTGLSRDYILREAAKVDFVEFSLARAKKNVGGALAKLAAPVMEVLQDMMDKKEDLSPKEQKEIIQLYFMAMDKFGMSEIDMSKGVVEDEVNSDEMLAEAIAAVRSLAGKCQKCGFENEVPVQRFISKAVYGTKQLKEDDAGGAGEAKSAGDKHKKVKVDTPVGSDTVVETIRVQSEVVKEPEKVSGDDNSESNQ